MELLEREPFGTDNYFDAIIKSDILNENEERRVRVFNHLDSIVYPAQRTDEWFAQREEVISASDIGYTIGLSGYTREYDVIMNKVLGKPFESSEACYHGKKYEHCATMIYEFRTNTKK